MKALTEYQQELLLKTLIGILGGGAETLLIDPKYVDFVNGSTSVIRVGLFEFSRNREKPNLFCMTGPGLKEGQTEVVKIIKAGMIVSGSTKIEFFLQEQE